jgi:hypothetical protein
MERARRGFLATALLAVAAASVPAAHGMDGSGDAQPFGSGGRADARSRLALSFVDCVELPADLLAAVRAETAAHIAALGVDAQIRTLPPGSDLDPVAVTIILVNAAPRTRLSRGVMGAVQRRGAIPALWIYAENVAAGTRLGWASRSRWTALERNTFATGMARVAVHEVVHLVCPWREHDDHGLMAGVLDRATLTGSKLPFTRELRRDFNRGVDALAGDASAWARGGPLSAADPAPGIGPGGLARSGETQ